MVCTTGAYPPARSLARTVFTSPAHTRAVGPIRRGRDSLIAGSARICVAVALSIVSTQTPALTRTCPCRRPASLIR